MKESIFLTSLLSNQRSGSNSLTSAAILVENCVVSKRVILVIPLRPSQRPFQVSSVPVPSAVTKPTPVTTTLLFCKIKPLECGLTVNAWCCVLLGFRFASCDCALSRLRSADRRCDYIDYDFGI